MAYNYAGLVTIANSMIKYYGRDVILRTGTFEAHANGLILDYSIHEIDGKLIERGDRRVLIDVASGVVPDAQTQRLVVDDKAYRIINVKTLATGPTKIHYELQVRA